MGAGITAGTLLLMAAAVLVVRPYWKHWRNIATALGLCVGCLATLLNWAVATGPLTHLRYEISVVILVVLLASTLGFLVFVGKQLFAKGKSARDQARVGVAPTPTPKIPIISDPSSSSWTTSGSSSSSSTSSSYSSKSTSSLSSRNSSTSSLSSPPSSPSSLRSASKSLGSSSSSAIDAFVVVTKAEAENDILEDRPGRKKRSRKSPAGPAGLASVKSRRRIISLTPRRSHQSTPHLYPKSNPVSPREPSSGTTGMSGSGVEFFGSRTPTKQSASDLAVPTRRRRSRKRVLSRSPSHVLSHSPSETTPPKGPKRIISKKRRRRIRPSPNNSGPLTSSPSPSRNHIPTSVTEPNLNRY